MSTPIKATALKGHEYGVYCLAYSPDGKTLVSGGIDSTARVWDLKTGKTVQTYAEHQNTIMRIAYSPDGKKIVSGDLDGNRLSLEGRRGRDDPSLER